MVINAIGQEDFNPSLPWVFKYDSTRNWIAGDVRAYMDNLKCVGWSLEHAWKLARQVASTLQHLGIQDAPRKRRIDAGPWARTLYHADKTTVSVMVMQKKWDKGRSYLATLVDLTGWDLDSYSYSLDQEFPDIQISYKLLEQIRGFFCHLAMTYPIIFPYLKGFHLTLASLMPGRDDQGWKVADLEAIAHLKNLRERGLVEDGSMDPSLEERGACLKDSPPTQNQAGA